MTVAGTLSPNTSTSTDAPALDSTGGTSQAGRASVEVEVFGDRVPATVMPDSVLSKKSAVQTSEDATGGWRSGAAEGRCVAAAGALTTRTTWSRSTASVT